MTDKNKYQTVAGYTLLEFFGLLFILLRFLARRLVPGGFKWDDWFMAVAAVFGLGFYAVGIYILGIDGWEPVTGPEYRDHSWTHATRAAKFAYSVIGVFCMEFVRISVCLFYGRIFSAKSRFRYFNNALLWISVLGLITFFVGTMAGCGNHFMAWFAAPNIFLEHCSPVLSMFIAMLILGALFDLITVLLPLYEISKLHLPLKRKLAVGAVFSVGLLAVAASIVRAVLGTIASLDHLRGGSAEEINTSARNVTLWAFVEFQVSVMAACMPTFGPLAIRIRTMYRRRLGSQTLKSRSSAESTTRPPTEAPTLAETTQESIRESKASERYPRLSAETLPDAAYGIEFLDLSDFHDLEKQRSPANWRGEIRSMPGIRDV